MVLKFNGSFLLNCVCTSIGNVIGRSIVKRELHTSGTALTRTQWSYTRPKNTGMRMDIPRRLIDGKYYRNQGKGGRGADGKIAVRHKGGGHSRNWRIVDKLRVPLHGPGEEPITIKDRVLQIGYDPFRTGNIALVAGNGSNQTKLILCPHETQVGDVLTSSRDKPVSLAKMIAGDAYPLEYLPYGTMVHSIEIKAGEGGVYCTAAGTHAILMQKTETQAILKEPGRKTRTELVVDLKALAVVGKVSNPGHKFEPIGKAGRSRWLNRKPRGKTGQARQLNKKKKVVFGPKGPKKSRKL